MSLRESIAQLLLIALPWAILTLMHRRSAR
jgi:hypothetical protein